MIVVMRPDAGDADIESVVGLVNSAGGTPVVSRGSSRTIIGLVGDIERFERLPLVSAAGVAEVIRISAPYKLVTREGHATRSTVSVAGVPFGPGRCTLIAGPCAVESPEQMLDAALLAKAAGATVLRGGAFKPRTSPYSFQGLGRAGLRILADVGRETDLPVVTEVLDTRDVDVVAAHADMMQIGARNMQNFALLAAVGAVGKPVLLKRGLSATIDEWLLAAEYVARAGTLDIVLCERGIRTFETATRNTLDISAIPLVQRLSHLPVIVDPSHSGGDRDLVLPLARAAVAAGADGLIVDVHPAPHRALCDGMQALGPDEVDALTDVVRMLSPTLGRTATASWDPPGDAAAEPPEGTDRISGLRREIDAMDTQIRDLVRRRTALSRKIVHTRVASGGERIAHRREEHVLRRYGELGPGGQELAAALLRLGRGPLPALPSATE